MMPSRTDGTTSRWVLVADRDEGAARGVAAALAHLGFWAFATPCGHQAVRLAGCHPLALAIVDERLADMPGLALARRLRRYDAALPLVITTGASARTSEVRARSLGIVHYAPKPLDLKTLQAVAEHASRTAPMQPR
jgi:DNA-binding response OmpR family regulator